MSEIFCRYLLDNKRFDLRKIDLNRIYEFDIKLKHVSVTYFFTAFSKSFTFLFNFLFLPILRSPGSGPVSRCIDSFHTYFKLQQETVLAIKPQLARGI